MTRLTADLALIERNADHRVARLCVLPRLGRARRADQLVCARQRPRPRRRVEVVPQTAPAVPRGRPPGALTAFWKSFVQVWMPTGWLLQLRPTSL